MISALFSGRMPLNMSLPWAFSVNISGDASLPTSWKSAYDCTFSDIAPTLFAASSASRATRSLW